MRHPSSMRLRVRPREEEDATGSTHASSVPKNVAPVSFEQALKCAICFESMVSVHVLGGNDGRCGHSFCGICIWRWWHSVDHRSCPLCRVQDDRGPIPNRTLDEVLATHAWTESEVVERARRMTLWTEFQETEAFQQQRRQLLQSRRPPPPPRRQRPRINTYMHDIPPRPAPPNLVSVNVLSPEQIRQIFQNVEEAAFANVERSN